MDNKQKTPSPIEHIRELLNQNRPADAMKFIDHLGQDTPVMENARGVCLMRLGKIEKAAAILRNALFQGQICIPTNAPVLYRMNFATVMLLSNQKDAAFPILKQIDAKEHPEAAKLKEAVQQWVKSLSFFERCRYHIGFYPKKPVTLDFPPGEV